MIDKSTLQIQQEQEQERARPVRSSGDAFWTADRHTAYGPKNLTVGMGRWSIAPKNHRNRDLGRYDSKDVSLAYNLAVRRINDYLSEHGDLSHEDRGNLQLVLNPNLRYGEDRNLSAKFHGTAGEVGFSDMPESLRKIVRDATRIADRTFDEVKENNPGFNVPLEFGKGVLSGAYEGLPFVRMGEGAGETVAVAAGALDRGIGAIGRGATRLAGNIAQGGKDAYWMARQFANEEYEGSKANPRAQRAERFAGR